MTKDQAERGADILEDIKALDILLEDLKSDSMEIKFYRSTNKQFIPDIIESLEKLKANAETELKEL